MKAWAAALLVGLTVGGPAAWAVDPGERLSDPALEARARTLGRELRCVVCQSQSIDDSNAPIAHDLRLLVRERLSQGDSDDAVKAYLRARYGDYILLDPPVGPETWALWFGPPALILIAAGLIARQMRRPPPSAEPLDPAERARLARLLDGAGD